MIRSDRYATTALGLCLAVVPLTASAQSTPALPDPTALYAPFVLACLTEPTVTDCPQVLEMVVLCAEDLEADRCELLFDGDNDVAGDAARREVVELMLSRAGDAAAPAVLAQADTEAAAERRLREMMEAARHAAEAEVAAQAEAEAEVEAAAQAAAQAEAQAAAQAAAQVEAEAAAQAAAQAAAGAASAEAAADAEAQAEARDEQLLRETLEAEQRTNAIETDAADRETAEIDRAAEGARLRAAAEALAEDAPELVIEDAPVVEFVAPADEQQALDAQQQSALDRLLEDPEVAAAVAVLGGVTDRTDADLTEAVRTDADRTDVDRTDVDRTEPRSGIATARAALRRERRGGTDDADSAVIEAPEVIEDAIVAGEVRSSRDDFGSRFALDFDAGQARRDDRRDLERAGLVALGALAVGMIINRNRVVARSDERVVVMRDDGEYEVWRDDDVILRQEGSQRRIERYGDGSTLTRWERPDGSQIVTVRDATGRVQWRERILADGTSIELVNDMSDDERIDVSVLPPPRWRELRITQRTDPAQALVLLREAEADARAVNRTFTLRQVREVREVRELVPVLSPEPITFETNRANVRPEEAPKLAQVGRLMERLIAEDPRELFLIEGHSDAVGAASYNLALSDRRAESVALALTEFFDIPPENLIIQGYGERYLRIPTAAAEERNRRVAIRRIAPLLGL